MARIENHKYSIEEAFRECFELEPEARSQSACLKTVYQNYLGEPNSLVIA